MNKNENTRAKDLSPAMRAEKHRRWKTLALGACLALLVTAAGFGSVYAQAGTGKTASKTKVIRAASEDSFADETAKLAKENRGLSIQSNGKVRPFASARLIVRVKDGKKVDFSRYEASTVIESDFGVCIVQFASSDKAKKAYKSIAGLSSVTYVETDDCSINTGDYLLEGGQPDEETLGNGAADTIDLGSSSNTVYAGAVSTSGTVSSSGMSWGASYIQADKYAAFVKANTSRSVKVAVVDSGVSSHTKLKGRVLKGKDYVDNDNNPSDKNGHGTHVAGVIVDCTPGIKVKILPVRVMNAAGYGTPSVVGNGIRYAVNNGAKVINLSLGGYEHYRYLEDCIKYAHSKGVSVVVAAGNENSSTYFVCPAHMSTPIVVGAINNQGRRASFSNFGSSLDIVAPGINIKSCWLNGKYMTASGTSMAAPHISAVAAMYWMMHPTVTPSKIEYYVRCYAKDLGAKGTDNYYGRGVPRMAGSITPSKVALSKTKASVQLKKTLTLKATITPSYAGKNKLTWSSSNSGVVSVAGGKLTAKKKGTATITVKTVNGKKATCKVTVTSATASMAAKSSAGSAYSTESKTTAATGTREEMAAAQKKKEAASAQAREQTDSGKTAGESAAPAETVKVYIYPSEEGDSTPVQDGSIVAGSRLTLKAETVPAQAEDIQLVWKSSDPSAASIDENGVVTAHAPGQTQITAEVQKKDADAAPVSMMTDGENDSDPVYTAGTGTFLVNVVNPSVLTRNASYDAAEKDQLQMQTVLRLPGTLEKKEPSDGEEVSSSAYVIALLREEEKDWTLLGAVNLGGSSSGSIHIHDSEDGEVRLDVRKTGSPAGTEDPDPGNLTALTDSDSGKTPEQTGILSAGNIMIDGGKADLSLAVDLEKLRAAMPSGAETEEAIWNCRIAAYTLDAFESREDAVKEDDRDAVRKADMDAVCSTEFGLTFIIPAVPVEGNTGAGVETAAPEERDSDGSDKAEDASDKTDDLTDQETEEDCGQEEQEDRSRKEEEEAEKAETAPGDLPDSEAETAEENSPASSNSSEEADAPAAESGGEAGSDGMSINSAENTEDRADDEASMKEADLPGQERGKESGEASGQEDTANRPED